MTEEEWIESFKKGEAAGIQKFEEMMKNKSQAGTPRTDEEHFHFLTGLLAQVMDRAYSWGRAHQFPQVIEYPQHETIQKIGWEIYRIGGEEKMREAIERVSRNNEDYGGLLNFFFRGIGQWMP